jgi:lipoic acid synthetase
MDLRYVVVTSVSRDDLPDGGAGQFALTVRTLRDELPEVRVEVLTPDFQGDGEALQTVLDARPEVFNHNVETVPSLYATVRPEADYRRSLDLLWAARQASPDVRTKSGLMLGLGETMDEVLGVLGDLRDVGCEMLTMGQYLQPRRHNLPVREYVRPEVFERLRNMAVKMGFRFVASGPLVRSSMNAKAMYEREEGVGYV